MYELIKYSIQSCLGDEQDYHKKEVIRLTNQIDECKETLKKMYLDQINNILDYELWVNLKNDYLLESVNDEDSFLRTLKIA